MPVRRGWIMLAVILGSAVVFLDGTIVNVALDTIGRELPSGVFGSLEGLTYVSSGYLAILAGLLLLAGVIGDRYGRRRVFAIGLTLFGITSVACGLAPTLELLILARLAQGAAGALLVPGGLAIITATFAGEERGRAIGAWAAATSAVVVVGPLIGGILVATVSWRAAFLVNVPLVVLGLYALRYVPESRDETATGRFDRLGAAVAIVAVGGLAFGVTRGQESGWDDPVAWVALAIGAAAVVAFPVLMVRRPDPLVPPSLFRSRAFSTINLSTLVVYGALYMSLTFQALFFQGTLGYTPIAAGLAALPVGLALTVLSTRFGRLAARLGPRRFLVAGPLVMAAGLAWFVRLPPTSDAWTATLGDPASLVPPPGFLVDVLPAQLVYGFGLALLVAPLSTALMGSIPTRLASTGSAINNAVSRVGAPLMGAVLFVACSAVFYPALGGLVPGLDVSDPAVREAIQPLRRPAEGVPPDVVTAATEASTTAFRLAMAVAAGALALGAAINLVGLREPGPAAGEPTS